MSLQSEIYDALRNDADVAEIVGARVFHSHLESFVKPCLLFKTRNIRNIESLDGGIIGEEQLLIVKSYADSETVAVSLAEEIDRVIRYYNSDLVVDVDKEVETPSYDEELKEFVITQEYRVHI